MRPQRRNHVWAYDFVALRTSDGKPVRLLTVVDEYTRECLAIHVGRSLRSPHVIECLGDLMVQRGVPEHLRSDNGPEFTARAVRLWLQGVGATTLFITPGSPWENGYVESFNGKLRDELLDREFFDTLWEVQVLTEQWRHEYNHQRPHSALGYRPPAPEAILTSSPGVEAVQYSIDDLCLSIHEEFDPLADPSNADYRLNLVFGGVRQKKEKAPGLCPGALRGRVSYPAQGVLLRY